MGRLALWLVTALGMSFAYVGINLRSTTADLTQAQVGYFEYANARNIARTGIHRYLRFVDGIPGYSGTPQLTGAFGGGSYVIAPMSSGDTLWMRSTGTYGDSTYTMSVKLLFTPKPFPIPAGAIGIAAQPASITFAGKAWVDGHNWNASGSDTVGYGDLPGISVMNPTDSAAAAASGTTGAGGNMDGNPPVAVDSTQIDPAAFIDEYEQSAHYYFNTPGNIAGNFTFGDPDHPVIVVCNAGEDTTFAIRFTGNVTGYGILAVNGNVKFGGGFNWYGLVIAYGMNNVVTFEATGTPQVVGGIIVAGNSGASLTLKGTGSGGKVKYSSEALAKARRIGRLLYYTVLDWYE